jgi:hypothetical protein
MLSGAVFIDLGLNVALDANGYFSSSILTIFLTAVVIIIYLPDEYCGGERYISPLSCFHLSSPRH